MKISRYTSVIITSVVIVFILTACNFGREPDMTPLPLNVPTAATSFGAASQIATIQRGDVVDRMVVVGKGALSMEEDIFFGVDGRVQSVHVDSGDEVLAGDLIAELNTRDFNFDVKLAEAAVELAELQLEKAQRVNAYTYNDAVQALTIVDIQMRRLEADENATAEDLEIQQIQLDRAFALVDRLEEGLYAEATSDVDKLTTEVERAKINLAKQKAQLGDMQIVAPLAGEVRLFDDLVAGQVVQAYVPVGVIVDPESLVIEANLVTEDLESLVEGMPVQVRRASLPDHLLAARILSLPQPFGSGVGLMTLVALENVDDLALIRPGISVEIVIELDRAEETLWLPPSAIRGFTDNYYVEKKVGGAVRETPVIVGLRNDEQVQILSGLEEGDQVVDE